MRIERSHVDWWMGYETLMIADPPFAVAQDDIDSVRQFIRNEKALLYVPIPFRDFADLAPLRHYPHERWERAMASLARSGDHMRGARFADIGGNVGYYTFLAAAEQAAEAVLVESSDKATWIHSEVVKLYGLSDVVKTERGLFQDWPFEERHVDIAFAFSSLPYIGQPDPAPLRAMLSRMAQHVGVSFIEMGDGGSELPWCIGDAAFEVLFIEAGFTNVEGLGHIFSSHTNTQRTLWRCDGQPD